MKITRSMTIEEVFRRFPAKSQKLAQAMMSKGLQCAGCEAATWETLESGMYGHGFSEEEIEELIGVLNGVLEEPFLSLGEVTLTQRAAEHFKKISAEEGKGGYGLRFGSQPGGCREFKYVLDFSQSASEEDEVFLSYGVEIHVNRNLLPRLQGSVIDYVDGLQNSGFKISNPNVKGSCSCGSSQNY